MMSALVSILASIGLFATSCVMLNALRLEKETGFTTWLCTMGFFVPWKILTWGYATVVNDIIFGYHLFTFFVWTLLHAANIFCWVVVYSLYLQLEAVTKLESSARLKIDTLGSTRSAAID